MLRPRPFRMAEVRFARVEAGVVGGRLKLKGKKDQEEVSSAYQGWGRQKRHFTSDRNTHESFAERLKVSSTVRTPSKESSCST